MKKELGIKDVMVGDWIDVRNNAAPNTPHPERITPSHFFRDEHWYGVELVPEILEKNGFEIISKGVYVYYNSAADGYIKIRLCDLLDGEWELYVDNYEKFDDSHYTFTIDRCFLKVHQLQHALRLCETEKEIIL